MYNLTDIKLSNKIPINQNCAILFIVNNNSKYLQFLSKAIQNINYLHDVSIYIICLDCKDQLQESYKNQNNIHIYDIEFSEQYSDIKELFTSNSIEFQYIKPFAIQFLKNLLQAEQDPKYFLYLDSDTFPIRDLSVAFEQIQEKPLVVKELGIDYNALGYDNYLNSTHIYRYIDIPRENRWGRNEPIVNTGVIGFDIDRDYDIIKYWLYVTIFIIRNHLRKLIKWWDQGCFMLSLEILNKKNIISNDRKYNYTILYDHLHTKTIGTADANIIHFIGDKKINTDEFTESDTSLADGIKISVASHTKNQFDDIHPRSYLRFDLLPKLNYDRVEYADNSLGESRIFLANDLFDQSSIVVGTVTGSWNKKYYPNKIDQLFNWPQFPILQRIKEDKSIVVCATICYGAYARHSDPLWSRNFQMHFRNEFRNSLWVQDTLKKITGLEYDGIRPAPYANQIICHKTVFYDLCSFIRSHIDNILESFTLQPNYDTPDKNRSLAYVMEELTMLWWSSQQNIQFIPVVEIKPGWYK